MSFTAGFKTLNFSRRSPGLLLGAPITRIAWLDNGLLIHVRFTCGCQHLPGAPPASGGNGLCTKHYKRWRKGGYETA